MISDILNDKIRDYNPENAIDQENVLQELMQHFVLASLSRSGFFSLGGFHGGTCLRVLHGMNRFSEDLNFLMKQSDPDFRWAPYLDRIRNDCLADGIRFEVQDKPGADSAVRKAFLKTDSIGQILILKLPFTRHQTKKIRIKLEV
ncbi:MAG: nucleotidyl transferase AbiEii/AbiGii toxin family protein, partial [Planctomycetes bacterium]|nr:nucleotidyl transferase AbiEii/AbiGii toxin family protein [Planctomycetota bacterium]